MTGFTLFCLFAIAHYSLFYQYIHSTISSDVYYTVFSKIVPYGLNGCQKCFPMWPNLISSYTFGAINEVQLQNPAEGLHVSLISTFFHFLLSRLQNSEHPRAPQLLRLETFVQYLPQLPPPPGRAVKTRTSTNMNTAFYVT